MKRSLLIITVALSLLTACREARYPIDEPAIVKIDTRLLGKWVALEKRDNILGAADYDMVYKVTKQSDNKYKIIYKDGKKKRGEKTTAYLSDINNELFLNVYVDGDSSGYLFLKIISIDADKIVMTGIADTTMEQLTSPSQVRERITKNLHNPLFYKDTVEMDRVK